MFWHVVSSIKITQNTNKSDAPFGFEVNMFHVLCCNNVYEGKFKLNSKLSNYYIFNSLGLSVCLFEPVHSDPLTVSARPILQPPNDRNEVPKWTAPCLKCSSARCKSWWRRDSRLLDLPSSKINKCIKIEKNEDRQNKNRKN